STVEAMAAGPTVADRVPGPARRVQVGPAGGLLRAGCAAVRTRAMARHAPGAGVRSRLLAALAGCSPSRGGRLASVRRHALRSPGRCADAAPWGARPARSPSIL